MRLVGTSVLQLFDFLNNWWFWFFKNFQNQRATDSGFWRKENPNMRTVGSS